MKPTAKAVGKKQWPFGTHLLFAATLSCALVAAIRVLGMAMPFPFVLLESQALTLLLATWPLLLIAALTKHKKLAITLCAVGLVHAYWAFEWLPSADSAEGPRERGMRLVAANLLAMRPSDAYAEELSAYRADVIVLEELSTEWLALLETRHSLAPFPYRTLEPHPVANDNFGLGVVSRFPIVDHERIAFGDEQFPLLRVDLNVHGMLVRLYAVHTMPPVSERTTNLQYRQHDILIARLLNDIANPEIGAVLAAGDFNATPSSFSYRRYRDLGLSPAHDAAMRAFQVRWPNGTSLIPPVRLDHVFLRGAGVHAVRKGRGVGSDHAPILVDLIMPPAT